MTKKPLFSIIIPVRKTNDYLKETVNHINKQSLKSFEILVITDKISIDKSASLHHLGPSFKRNLGAKMAKGQYLAFLDDDSYPDLNWLKNAQKIFKLEKNAAAVCGPCLTPPKDNWLQQASGLFWSTWMGSGGAGVYRNSVRDKRYVSDYPTVNLIVRKKDFLKIKGFNNQYWPGEDTILCLDIIKKLKKQIVYDPSIKVFHHRREVMIPHLQQITRYAIHRGFFAKKFPETSFKIGYFLPSFFTLYIFALLLINLSSAIISPLNQLFLWLFSIPLFCYLILLFYNLFIFLLNKINLPTSIITIISIPITHIYYGSLFLWGLSKNSLDFQPHKVNTKTGEYIGG
ncbi:MAG: glycosyltransferase [Candidatus Shapirobacteria bacterium]|nr:glycosyltransferase [Candidatus Shapirobacteria bacterium]